MVGQIMETLWLCLIWVQKQFFIKKTEVRWKSEPKLKMNTKSPLDCTYQRALAGWGRVYLNNVWFGNGAKLPKLYEVNCE